MSNVERIMNLFESAIMKVDSAVVIEKGDFVAKALSADVTADDDQDNAGYAIPVSKIADAGSDSDDRVAAADQLVGIAMQASEDDEDDDILVAIGAKVKITLESSDTIEVGEGVEVFSDGGCSDQEAVQGDTSPIGFAVEKCDSSSTVYVTLRTRMFTNETS